MGSETVPEGNGDGNTIPWGHGRDKSDPKGHRFATWRAEVVSSAP